MGKEIHTNTGYFTDGTYIKYKSGYTKNWKVETANDTYYFLTEEKADEFINDINQKRIANENQS